MAFGCAPVPTLMGDSVIDAFLTRSGGPGAGAVGAVSRGVRMRFGFTAGAWRRGCCRAGRGLPGPVVGELRPGLFSGGAPGVLPGPCGGAAHWRAAPARAGSGFSA